MIVSWPQSNFIVQEGTGNTTVLEICGGHTTAASRHNHDIKNQGRHCRLPWFFRTRYEAKSNFELLRDLNFTSDDFRSQVIQFRLQLRTY